MKPELPWLNRWHTVLSHADATKHYRTQDGWDIVAELDPLAEVCGATRHHAEDYAAIGRCGATPLHEHPHIWIWYGWKILRVTRVNAPAAGGSTHFPEIPWGITQGE